MPSLLVIIRRRTYVRSQNFFDELPDPNNEKDRICLPSFRTRLQVGERRDKRREREASHRPTKMGEWELTQAAFNMLLAKLDADPEKAGLKYELLRRKIVLFVARRGCYCPEDLFDIAINRTARKIEQGEEIGNLNACVYGTALNVWKEWVRKEIQVRTAPPAAAVRVNETEDKRRTRCYETCLAALPEQRRELMLQYYQRPHPADRNRLSEKLGLTQNALYKRAFDIRTSLGKCQRKCMQQWEM